MASTLASVGTGCMSFILSVVPPLRTYYFDFDENVRMFEETKRAVECMRAVYNDENESATRDNKMIPQKDVVNWIRDYEEKLEECGPLLSDLGTTNSGRNWWPCQICKLNMKLLKMTEKMTELSRRFNEFRSSMFTVDLNRNILDKFENTKSKFEALTACRSLEELSDQSGGTAKWIQDYEEIKRQCNDIENNLKNYNTKEGESFNVVIEDLDKKTTEMTVLIDRYNQFFSFEKKKKEFDAMIKTYGRERKEKAEKYRKIPTELVRVWIDDCKNLQKKYDGGITEIQEEGESSHRQEERIGQMEEMEYLITRYHQFNGFSNMFVDQPLETVEKVSTDYKPLDSMEKNKETVYTALKNEMVIRLFGIGGIGKSTLMQQINNEMSHGSDFELVIWVTVSNTFADIKSIQHKIYDRLINLEWVDREDNNVRAEKISEYLKNSVDGSTLFIFDDVWKMLDLNVIGIPCGTYGNDGRKCCKIILTTRDRNVKVIHERPPKDIEMKELNEDESWILFKTNASIEDEDNVDNGIKEIAEKICKKCSGLPLVITVIAKMLNREKEKALWSETLKILNQGDPFLGIPDLLNDVYIPLKLSYDHLGREDWKIGFLLCSFFPEDCEIAVSDLFCYGIGAGEIAKSCQRLDACRSILIHLKNKGLLQDVKEPKYENSSARMHDVIRDVAHFIAKDEFGGFFCKLFGQQQVLRRHLDVQKLRENVLLDLMTTSIEPESAIKEIMKLKELRVLMYNNYDLRISVNIKQYFILHMLSVLCLQNVYIKELDKDFSIELCNLRVIDFSWTAINVIRPKAFSNLNNKLEVLCMLQSFRKWRASDEEDGEYANFAELAELKKLHTLQVDICDLDIFSHKYRFDLIFSSVECFSINTLNDFRRWDTKSIGLPQRPVKNVANWIKDLLKKTKYLEINMKRGYLQNDIGGTEDEVVLTYDIIVNTICNLEELIFEIVPTCKYAIQYSNTEGNHTTSKPILPKAKVLDIFGLEKMENIFLGTLTPTVIPKGSFGKLQSIKIWNCPRLKFIFPWNVATCLVQLKTLDIHSCEQLEVIIETEDNRYYNKGEHVWFPKLIKMKLFDLPELECMRSERDENLKNLKQKLLLDENSAPNLPFIDWDNEIYDMWDGGWW